MSRSKAKTALEWDIYRSQQIPAPHDYDVNACWAYLVRLPLRLFAFARSPTAGTSAALLPTRHRHPRGACTRSNTSGAGCVRTHQGARAGRPGAHLC